MSEQAKAPPKSKLSNGTWAVVTFIAVFVFGWLVYRQGIPPVWLRDFAADIALRAAADPDAPLPEDSRQATPRGLANSPYICAANVIPLAWDKLVVATTGDEARQNADLGNASWTGAWDSAGDLANELARDPRYQAVVLLKDGKVQAAELFFTFWADLKALARPEGFSPGEAVFVAAVRKGTYVLTTPAEIPRDACPRKAQP